MNHLIIEQEPFSYNRDLHEPVDMNIIAKLAEIGAGLDATSDLKGKLTTANAYEDDLAALSRFSNLDIQVTGGAYIRIADPAVLAVLNDSRYASTFHSDGVGITSAAALLITSLSPDPYTHPFRENADIVSFDELAKLTNVTSLSSYEFNNDTNLESIDLKNITTIGGSCFYSCTSLNNVANAGNVEQIGAYAFNGCSSLTSIDTSGVKTLQQGAFANCASLTHFDTSSIEELYSQNFGYYEGVVELPNLKNLYGSTFNNAKKITKIVIGGTITSFPDYSVFSWMDRCVGITHPASLQTMGKYNFQNLSGNLRYIKILATTPPTLPTDDNDISNKTNLKVYVPDSANDSVLNAYKAASGWSMFASKIYNMSQFAVDFPND